MFLLFCSQVLLQLGGMLTVSICTYPLLCVSLSVLCAVDTSCLTVLCSCNIRAAADRSIRLASVDGDADRLVYHYFDSEVLRCIRMMWPLSAMFIASEWMQWTATAVYFISPGTLAPAGW